MNEDINLYKVRKLIYQIMFDLSEQEYLEDTNLFDLVFIESLKNVVEYHVKNNYLSDSVKNNINEYLYQARNYNDENKIERYIDSGAACGRVVQFFIHPHYLSPTYAKITSTFNALNKIKSHIAEKGYKVWYTTTNNITDYWHKRSASEITECKNGEFAVNALCPLCLVLPDGAESAYINGEKPVIHEKTVNGKALKLISLLEKGKYDIKVEYSL